MALNGSAAPMLMRETEGRQSPESEWVRRAWDLRIDGCSVREIAQRLGISYAQARRLVQLAYTDPGIRLSETAEVARELDSARLDQLIRAYSPLALNTRTVRVRRCPNISPSSPAGPLKGLLISGFLIKNRPRSLYQSYCIKESGPSPTTQFSDTQFPVQFRSEFQPEFRRISWLVNQFSALCFQTLFKFALWTQGVVADRPFAPG
jgi:hypothetical protein